MSNERVLWNKVLEAVGSTGYANNEKQFWSLFADALENIANEAGATVAAGDVTFSSDDFTATDVAAALQELYDAANA